MRGSEYDAVIVGSGPNGLAAATTLAEAGASVLVIEGTDQVGGGTRTAELTLPGFRHDMCSAIHPLGAASPYFASLPLAEHGLEWAHPEVLCAHPLDDGRAGALHRSVEETADAVGEPDRWRRLIQPVVDRWPEVAEHILGPPLRLPHHPVALTRFGVRALLPANTVTTRYLRDPRANALFIGMAAHTVADLRRPLTSAAALVFAAAGAVSGWPAARGGSQAIADALVGHLRSLGGTIETGRMVTSIDELPPAGAVLFDTTPRQLLAIAGHRLPDRYRRRLERYRYGAGSFKLDLALDGPVPWTAEACRRAGTVHLGGTGEEVAAAELDVQRGRHPERPFVLVGQQSLFDDTRAPAGKHTLWTYCHVPAGSTVDMTERIEAQIERFAPGFRDLILARHTSNTADLEAYNPNFIGGDIAGGASGGLQLLARPVLARWPYRTPADGIYLCSSSTPPGAGVHGMSGHWAATSLLAELA